MAVQPLLYGYPAFHFRVLALSGGYAQDEANKLLAKNHNMLASFSRALSQGLSANQSDADFNQTIQHSIQNIYAASIKK
jgi:fructose-bisphosphate aldolase class I